MAQRSLKSLVGALRDKLTGFYFRSGEELDNIRVVSEYWGQIVLLVCHRVSLYSPMAIRTGTDVPAGVHGAGA